jgi:uncharacterized OB-fold protein
MGADEKPIPVATDQDRPYWEGAKEHKLVLQRCTSCSLLSAEPRVVCPRCQGTEFDWTQVSGRGVIHSYGILRQSPAPGFRGEGPVVLVKVQIDEEPTCRITANLLVDESQYDDLDLDLPVEVTFEDRGDVTLPQFKLA